MHRHELLAGVDDISYSNSFRGENVQRVQPSIEAGRCRFVS
jgi:hypothetical protein